MSAPAPAMFSPAAMRRIAQLGLRPGRPNLDVFAETLLELARADRNVVAVTSDSRGSGKLGPFGQALPRQIVEVGIAEQNLVGIAAGLASCGKNVFAVSPACFLTARSLEQVKNDVAYSDNPVTLVGISAGVSYGALGSTHHSLHDFAALRAIHNLELIVPADNAETRAAVRLAAARSHPVYLRFGKAPLYDLHAAGGGLELGAPIWLRPESELVFVATGETVVHALLAAADLQDNDGLACGVLSVPTLKPLDAAAILAVARGGSAIVTVEEHMVHGGLGEACAAVLAEAGTGGRFKAVGIPDVDTVTGSQADIFRHYGISMEGLARTARELLGRRSALDPIHGGVVSRVRRRARPPCRLAIDQSTSGTKVMLFDADGAEVANAAREHRQFYPQPGWVEHDAEEIWRNLLAAAREVIAQAGETTSAIAGVSLTNQRETLVIFERATGMPLHPAIVWQCRRGDEGCREHVRAGFGPRTTQRTGLRVDSYFSASKAQWLVRQRPDLARKLAAGEALLGTIDTYLVFRLTRGAVFATDPTNASRTLLYDIGRLQWDDELCAAWQVPRRALADVRPSAGCFGTTTLDGLLPQAVPIHGVMGDSQASLFAQRCFVRGMGKVTFGSGSSVLLNVGSRLPRVSEGSVAALAWVLDGQPTYALEGIITASASTITWLRDQLGLVRDAHEAERLAVSVADNGGVYLVPAFSGLGAPHWKASARAVISGLSAHSDRRHIARAALESIAYQVRDVLETLQAEAGIELRRLGADGGPTANIFLMQFVADLTGAELRVAEHPGLSALGAAMMGMLGSGSAASLEELQQLPRPEKIFRPEMDAARVRALRTGWRKALDQVLHATDVRAEAPVESIAAH